MKKRQRIVSLLLIFCLILSTFSLTGCSDSDIAAIKEELSLEYEWEEVFVSEVDGEILTISRRHDDGFLGVHCTTFKITIYDENGNCTHFHSSSYTPCKNGFLECDGDMASLEDATHLSSTIEELYPYVADVTGYLVVEKMVSNDITSHELSQELFFDLVDSYFDTQKEDIISEVKVSAISSVADYNDYAEKLAEVGFSIEEAADTTENSGDLFSFARSVIPGLEEIEEGLALIKLFFGIEHATANRQLDEIAGKTTDSKDPAEVIVTAKKDLHNKFKDMMASEEDG